MKPKVGITASHMTAITNALTRILADAVILYTKTRKFHWNVSGNSFVELHELFEAQYRELEAAIDDIAERINQLGSKTPGTLQEFLDHGTLKEYPGKYPGQQEMLKELLKDHEAVVMTLRKTIADCDEKWDDIGTSDFLTDLIRQHEKMAWKLRRYLPG